MITIKEPIKLNCRDQIKTTSDNLHHRILANYQLMPVELGQEELLHMMTSPPEIYLAQEETTTILNKTTIFDNKEIKMDVINNLLNRLSVQNQFEWTYQDQVYIETVLRKLGIKNTISFMEEIKKKIEQNQSLEQKIEKYWNYLITYEENQENNREELMIDQKEFHYENGENRIHLHENIMKRLQTGLIYQILDNFNSKTSYDNRSITNHQLNLSEQKMTARQIFLNQMETYLTGTEIPFIYLENNTFERLEEQEEYYEEKEINRRITEAVLHRLIESVHLERMTGYKEEKHLWINIKNALYQTAENTLFRMQNLTNFKNEIQKRADHILERREYVIQNYHENRELNLKTEQLIHPEKLILEENEVNQETLLKQETKELQQELFKINQKNLENLEKFQTILQEKKEIPKARSISREERRRESLKALQEPEALLLQYKKEERLEKTREETVKKEILEHLPADTRYVLETIERFKISPDAEGNEKISKNNLALLMQDTQLIHRETMQEERLDNEIHKISSETEKIIEHWQQERKEPLQMSETRQLHQAVSMIHKQEKQSVEEEVLQEILEQNRRNVTEKKEQEILQSQKSTITTVHRQEETRITEKNMQDITRLIDQGVKRQIGSISDQVYHRLEKKLSNEKKRRGF